MFGIAICGRSVLSAMALARPIVEPPPSATRQSAPAALVAASASSVKPITDKSLLNNTEQIIAGVPKQCWDNSDSDDELRKRHEVIYLK